MAKTIIIKVTESGQRVGPFDITDNLGNIIDTNVSLNSLIDGITYIVDDLVEFVTLTSVGKCTIAKTNSVGIVSTSDLTSNYTLVTTSCLWKHLTDESLFNNYYGYTDPYIIEYPFSYNYQDEILRNVKDYTKVFKYMPDGTDIFNPSLKIETDDEWFNKAVVYNGQQSSGILELISKPVNNLQSYLQYPIYRTSSKVITYTKSDNFYQYNDFWSVVKYKKQSLFIPTCESRSIDKVVNQDNMDYTMKSFTKSPIRAKDLRVRHILDNKSNIHLVSQFIFHGAQISYK